MIAPWHFATARIFYESFVTVKARLFKLYDEVPLFLKSITVEPVTLKAVEPYSVAVSVACAKVDDDSLENICAPS